MVLLEPGEVQIAIVPARYRGIAGALTLTDRHLVFERTTGVVSKRIRTIFSLPLTGIDSVSIEGEPQRTVLVVTTLRGEVIGPPRHEVHVDHAEGLEPENPRSRGRGQDPAGTSADRGRARSSHPHHDPHSPRGGHPSSSDGPLPLLQDGVSRARRAVSFVRRTFLITSGPTGARTPLGPVAQDPGTGGAGPFPGPRPARVLMFRGLVGAL